MKRTILSLATGLAFARLPTILCAQTEMGLPDRSQAAMLQQPIGVTAITDLFLCGIGESLSHVSDE